MKSDYNEIAGRSLSRLAALSDGIFAVAMTLLVFDHKPPSTEGVTTDADLAWALLGAGWQLILLALSFLTLGLFWVAQQTQYHYLAATDRRLTWLQLAFLFVVTLTPFATRVLIEFPDSRLAVLLYWLLIFSLGSLLRWSWDHAERAGLVHPDAPPTVGPAFRFRVRTAQLLYTLALSLWGFLIVQFGYVFGLDFHHTRSPIGSDESDARAPGESGQ